MSAFITAPLSSGRQHDENQRLVPLAFSPTVGGLSVTLPANGNLAPAGHYLLFILNDTGVPSVARIVQLH